MLCRCIPVCNRCKFRSARVRVGHCKKTGRLFRCTRRPLRGFLPTAVAVPPVPAGLPPLPDDYGNGGFVDDGDEGNEGDEGDEGNEGATEVDYDNDDALELDMPSDYVDDYISYVYDEIMQVEVPPKGVPPVGTPALKDPPGLKPLMPAPKQMPPMKAPPQKARGGKGRGRRGRGRKERGRKGRGRKGTSAA